MLTRALKKSQQLDQANSTHICSFDIIMAFKQAESPSIGVQMLEPHHGIVIVGVGVFER
jgi:hypothetical protein